jgi:hypothetical protein
VLLGGSRSCMVITVLWLGRRIRSRWNARGTLSRRNTSNDKDLMALTHGGRGREVGDLRYDTGSDTQLPTSHDRNPHLTLVINELRSAQYGYVKTRVYAGLSRWVCLS